MNLLTLIFLVSVCVVPLVHAADKTASSGLPSKVAEFKERRDLCEHFLGEEPYDEERRIFLEKNIRKYCTGTDKELSSLKEKYKDNKAVLKTLADYDDDIE